MCIRDRIGGADDLYLFVAFGLQDFGIARVGKHVAQPLGAADRMRILARDHRREFHRLGERFFGDMRRKAQRLSLIHI